LRPSRFGQWRMGARLRRERYAPEPCTGMATEASLA
jgi:hypothetical protein